MLTPNTHPRQIWHSGANRILAEVDLVRCVSHSMNWMFVVMPCSLLLSAWHREQGGCQTDDSMNCSADADVPFEVHDTSSIGLSFSAFGRG